MIPQETIKQTNDLSYDFCKWRPADLLFPTQTLTFWYRENSEGGRNFLMQFLTQICIEFKVICICCKINQYFVRDNFKFDLNHQIRL